MNASTIRVLTYNLHKGFDFFSRKFVLAQMKKLIDEVHADLVFLQEVQGAHSNQDGSQFEFLAGTLWPHTSYGKNAIYEKGHHGNAILSKFPIVNSGNLDLSTNRLEKRGLLQGTAVFGEGKNEKRIQLFNTHLNLFGASRKKQLDRITGHIADVTTSMKGDPLILAGDFNDWDRKAGHALQSKLGLVDAFESLHQRHARTFPSFLPFMSLDRIYVRGCTVLSAQVLRGQPWDKLSDHSPILAELKL